MYITIPIHLYCILLEESNSYTYNLHECVSLSLPCKSEPEADGEYEGALDPTWHIGINIRYAAF